MSVLFDTVRIGSPAFGPAFLSSHAEGRAVEAAFRETLRFRSGPDTRNKQLWSGSGVGHQGSGPLSAAGKGSP
jgi:hypothetical protein